MRIMLLTNLPPAYGGLEVFASHLTCALGDEFEFVIAGCADDGPAHRFQLPHRGRVRHIETRWRNASPSRLGRLRDVAFALRHLDRCIQAEEPDVIVLQATDLFHPLLSALMLARRVKARVVVAFHIPHTVIFARLRRLSRWTVKQGLLRADLVIGVSRGLVDDVGREFGIPEAKRRVFSNPVPVARIEARARQISIEPSSTPSIVHIARIDPLQKNQKLLLLAFAKVLAQVDARLDILGDGAPDAELSALLARPELACRVRLHGFQADTVPWMKRASMLVLSSNYEGLAYVLVEALAAGCPVVSTDCPHGPREVLRDGEYGLLTPPGDVDALADAMLRMLRDEALRRDFAQRGHDRAREFALERGTDRYRQLFRALGRSPFHSAALVNASSADGKVAGSAIGAEQALSEQK